MMVAQKSRHAELLKPIRKGPRYTPVSRRQDRPDAIAWFVRNHPEISDAVRDRTHWNSTNIKPVDPVTLGLITQLELDAVVKTAAEKRAREDARRGIAEPQGATLQPADAAVAEAAPIEDEDGDED
jgi:hypothetical protein